MTRRAQSSPYNLINTSVLGDVFTVEAPNAKIFWKPASCTSFNLTVQIIIGNPSLTIGIVHSDDYGKIMFIGRERLEIHTKNTLP